jgi:prepilin-type N-terminal cleavage/methylation domain-containing protein
MSFSRITHRCGVTLVELMVVIAILGVLMSTILFALQGANEQARADRTRAEIVKINDLIMTRWEGYRSRPMPMRINYSKGANASTMATNRLLATWELMRMELPERIADLRQPAVFLKTPGGAPLQPALWRAYRKKAEALSGGYFTNWPTSTENVSGPDIATKWTPEYSNAECLYLILSTIREGDTNGLDFFTPREVGDVDGDGMPEVLDGWNRPIRFLRWAPGFSTANGAPTKLQTGVASTHPDPFDPYKLYPTHFALFPLIYSAGPDGRWGVDATDIDYAVKMPPNDPYASVTTPPTVGAVPTTPEPGGSKDDWLDNVTNHLTVTR